MQIPLVLVSQDYKNQQLVSIHHDIHPQLFIRNKSGIKLYCAQFTDDNSHVVSDCDQLKWTCKIDNDCSSYYTMPVVSKKFPEISQNIVGDKLVFASDPEGIDMI